MMVARALLPSVLFAFSALACATAGVEPGGIGIDASVAGAADAAVPDGSAADAPPAGEGELGDPCTSASSCASGVCWTAGDVCHLCTVLCDEAHGCPSTWLCTPLADVPGSSACVPPAGAEMCDGMDNDCDPATADGSGDPRVGQSCDGPDVDRCEEGVLDCATGALRCSDVTGDSLDVCDGMDNDCDPATADGRGDPRVGQPCDGPDVDLCAEGVASCAAGHVSCSDATGDTAELCDGLDNDCDGTIETCHLVEACGCVAGQACDVDRTTLDPVCRPITVAGGPGTPCEAWTECQSGTVCMTVTGSEGASCHRFCENDSGCTGAAVCTGSISVGDTSVNSFRTCSDDCSPVTAAGCAPGWGCRVSQDTDRFVALCTAGGAGTQGVPCAVASDCAPGYDCLVLDGDSVCLAGCQIDSLGCPFGTNCGGASLGIVIGGIQYGFCY